MPHQLTLLDAGQIKRPNNPFKESNNMTHPEMFHLPLTLKRRPVFVHLRLFTRCNRIAKQLCKLVNMTELGWMGNEEKPVRNILAL